MPSDSLSDADRAIAGLTAQRDELRVALEPFAKLADTWTVEAAARERELLTLSNGRRMSGIDAGAFLRARAALARAREESTPFPPNTCWYYKGSGKDDRGIRCITCRGHGHLEINWHTGELR